MDREALLKYVLARLQERSTVAGLVMATQATFALTLPADPTVTAVIALAGLAAALIPGGK